MIPGFERWNLSDIDHRPTGARTVEFPNRFAMKEIGPQELKRMQDAGDRFLLIDVREPYEAERCSIGGTLIPMGEIVERKSEIPTDIPVVIHCRSGNRSAAVVNALSTRYGFTNLINLKGGILGYGKEVDDGMTCD